MTDLATAKASDATIDRAEELLRVENVSVTYHAGGGFFGFGKRKFAAVDNVNFSIAPGETLGLIGESGSGKSTVGRAIMRAVPTSSGRIEFAGSDITQAQGAALKRLRREIQMIFQDPYASLNPRMRIFDILAEPLLVHGIVKRASQARERVMAMLESVGLPADAAQRTPQAFSGGQRQRISIARALMLGPRLIIADEPVSALDVSVRAQILNLIRDLQAKLGTSYLFISHDLTVVRNVSHRVAILYLGQIVEIADSASIYARPWHPYTQLLFASAYEPDPEAERNLSRLARIGELPSAITPPPGCRFHTRCPKAGDICRDRSPSLERKDKDKERWVACWFAEAS